MTELSRFDSQVLVVARRHGTDVAAVWSGRSRSAVVALRQRVDGYTRGRGHPTRAKMEAAKPRPDCPCPRCRDWRRSEAATARLRAARERHEKDLRRRELTARMTELIGTDEEWRLAAACLGEPTETFFGPDGAGPGSGSWVAAALAICARCPVRQPCLDHAMRTQTSGHEVGVFGGTSARERKRLRAERKASAS